MKYIFDYSSEEQEGIELASRADNERLFLLSLRSVFSAPHLDQEKLDLLCELIKLMDSSACAHRGCLEVIVDETKAIGLLVWRGWGYDMFSDEGDTSKAAFSLALKHALSIHLRSKDDDLEIHMIVKLGI